ncbi:MAG TPA: TetR/AcrR family transcriptional regulator [Nocardioides sp.]|nr:TetR/AcrR family transcriptional regulator [Nocardioides sp.]
MTVQQQRHDVFRAAVLASAETEFARVGYDRAKVAAVAKGADVSLATVYKLFDGKQDIWDQLHAERMQVLLERVRRRGASAGTPLDRLLAGIAGVAEFLTEHDDYLALSLDQPSGWLAPGDGVGVQRSVWSAGLEMIRQGVDAAVAAEEIEGMRPGVASRLVVSVLQVWLAEWVESGRDRPADDLVADLVGSLRGFLTVNR